MSSTLLIKQPDDSRFGVAGSVLVRRGTAGSGVADAVGYALSVQFYFGSEWFGRFHTVSLGWADVTGRDRHAWVRRGKARYTGYGMADLVGLVPAGLVGSGLVGYGWVRQIRLAEVWLGSAR